MIHGKVDGKRQDERGNSEKKQMRRGVTCRGLYSDPVSNLNKTKIYLLRCRNGLDEDHDLPEIWFGCGDTFWWYDCFGGRGENDYISFVDKLLNEKLNKDNIKFNNPNYELAMFDDMSDMMKRLQEMENEFGLCRSMSWLLCSLHKRFLPIRCLMPPL